jgi:twitching motility protein PilT
MAQLDKLISAMVSRRADALHLNEGEPATLDVQGTRHPLTKALSGPQIAGLLNEIAKPAATKMLEAKQPTKFRYDNAEGAFLVRAMVRDTKWLVQIAVDDKGDFERKTGTFRAVGDGDVSAMTPPASGVAVGSERRPSVGMSASAVSSTASNAGGTVAGATADAPAARLQMDKLLRLLVEKSGSDLHLRCGEPPIIRLHGEMSRLDGFPVITNDDLEAMLYTIMPDRNRKEFRETHDTDYAYEIEGVARFRANASRERKGAAAVFRVIPATVVTADQLGLSQEIQNLCYLTKGLVLVTGPTGSGKSTTLCALVDLVNRVRTDHVITIEDPIEFVHHNKNCIITQRQVGVHTQSFKAALRAALREDPDIILVGELRDLETVSIAIETAETGHLVFGTLHTTTAPSTIDRLIDQFPADRQEQIRIMLSESLKGVIAQTLLKKIGGGRVAAKEVLLSIPAVSNLIREGKTFQIPSVMQTSKRLGMITLNDALMELVDTKQVEPKEAYMKSIDKVSFVNALRVKGHDTTFMEGDPAAAANAPPGSGKPEPPARPAAQRPATAGKR